MVSSGALGAGCSPFCQCQEDSCLSTDGVRVMIEIGTLWVAPGPLTEVWGWWSPSTMSTRFGSFSSVTHEVRAVSEYWIDLPKNWRTVLLLRQTVAADSLSAGCGANPEPLPTLFQGTMVGNGAHGMCEEVVSISAITGLWPGISTFRWNAAKVYWSGMAE